MDPSLKDPPVEQKMAAFFESSFLARTPAFARENAATVVLDWWIASVTGFRHPLAGTSRSLNSFSRRNKSHCLSASFVGYFHHISTCHLVKGHRTRRLC